MMAARKATKKIPSPAQLRARKAFAAAAKARSKAARIAVATVNKRKRNKTIIKARTIKHLDVSKIHNPYQDLVIKGTATKTPQGWKIGKKTIPQGKGTVNVSSGYKLDKATGTIYAKRARNIAQGFYDGNGVFHPIRASADYVPAFAGDGRDIIDVHRKKKPAKKAASKTRSRRNPKKLSEAEKKRRMRARKLKRDLFWGKTVKMPKDYSVSFEDIDSKKKNVAQGFFDGNGIFHPIRSASDYDDNRVGVHTRSKKRKAATKRASQTAKSHAESKRRKATTSRLASRGLSRSYSLPAGSKSRRQRKNPGFSGWQEYGPDQYGKRSHKLMGRGFEFMIDPLFDFSGTKEKFRGYMLTGRIYPTNEAIRPSRPFKTVTDAKKAAGRVYARHFDSAGAFKKHKRNPSPADNRKEFAGHYSGDKSLRFPDGTPTGLSKLGTLKLIKTEAGTLKPSQGTAWLCRDQKGKLHIGTTRLDGVVYGGDAGSFGKVELIEYDETKKHLYPNSGRIRFYHKMGEEDGKQPVLYSDGKGGLKFKGGNYRIESRGIVN